VSYPDRIGRYTVCKRLGSGAFALVWLGHDEMLDAEIAIKVLAENWADQLDLRTRFVEEARVLRRADSDRVVRVFDIGDLPDGRPYFVMTYADLGSLADRLADGPLPAVQALRHGEEIARGVGVLHETGVIHRDIKPSNVLFRSTADRGERLLIADLGLSKAMEFASGFTVAAGSPGYMAPEQAVPGRGIDHRLDVYGIGATVYRALTGQVPANDNQLPPSTLRQGLPDGTDAIVLRAIAADPERRWPTANALANALQGLADLASAENGDTTVRQPHVADGHTQAGQSRERLRLISRAALAPPSPDTYPMMPPSRPRPAPPARQQPPAPERAPSGPRSSVPFARPPLRDPLSYPDPPPPPSKRRGARRWLLIAAVAVLLLAAGGFLLFKDELTSLWRGADSGSSTGTPAALTADLGIDTQISNPPCDGRYIVIVGSAMSADTYAADIQGFLDEHPGAAYLHSASTGCSSLRQFADDGTEIYATYYGPFTDAQEACDRKAETGGDAFVRVLDNTTPPEDVVSCEG
jgi:serine/threonine protein kinase